jgi:membrane associated rhomboid family serine protease
MSKSATSPLEQVLRLCAKSAPEPWYPRVFARETETSKEYLSEIIEHLLLDGLLERTTGSDETGPGLVLSRRGAAVLKDSEALEKLRQGAPMTAGDQGGIVREALRRQQTPYVSRALLAINILVFIYGIYLGAKNDALMTALTGYSGTKAQAFRDYAGVLQQDGSITATAWLRGEWWRTLTACFVHIGLVHLGMNMYMLYVAGGFLERMWGRSRFLAIYLIAGVVGTCVGLAHNAGIMELSDGKQPDELCIPLAGASTALCGIIAAEAIWVWLNHKFLPQSLVERWRNNIVIQFVMIVFISFFPGISGWGHFGGAVAGALAALLLNYQRFGPNPWRWAALLGLLPLPLLGLGEIHRMRTSKEKVVFFMVRFSDTSWRAVEELDFKDRCSENGVHKTMTPEQTKVYRDLVQPLLDMDPKRREESKAAEVNEALNYLSLQKGEWSGYLTIVDNAGPYYGEEAKESQTLYRDAISAILKLYELAERCLRSGVQWTDQDETALREQTRIVKEIKIEKPAKAADKDPAQPSPNKDDNRKDQLDFEKNYLPAINKAAKTFHTLWDDSKKEIVRPVKERPEKVIANRLTQLQAQQKEMSDLAERLDKIAPYKDAGAEEARQVGSAFLREAVTWCRLAERCLREPDKWTDEDAKKLDDQEKKTEDLRVKWRSLLGS